MSWWQHHKHCRGYYYYYYYYYYYHMYYKTDQHSSSSCKGTCGLLHIMGSNTMIVAVLKVWLICTLTLCYTLRIFYTDFYRAACNADALLWWDFCPSVCPSVTRVDCDKTEERSVQIYIPYERTFILVLWEKWLVRGDPFYVKFWVNRPPLERNHRFSTNNRS